MPRLLLGRILAVTLMLGGLTGFQEPPQEGGGSEIVVTGTRELEGQIRDFVAALTGGQYGTQLSRFERAICPMAIGLPEAQRTFVAHRMRQVAEAGGIAVGREQCTPNVLVVVTRDKRAFIEALQRQHSYYFGELSRREVRRLAELPGPAVAWQVQGSPVNAAGQELNREGATGLYVNRTTTSPSRITAAARPQFAAAMVIVEAGALVGLSTTQLADYAAMRAYARVDPTRLAATQAPTILTVLEAPMGSAVPLTLTRWDLGFLRGLYESPPNLTAAADRSAIRRTVEDELAQPESPRQ